MHIAIEAVGVKHSGGAVVLLDVLRALLRSPQIQRVTLFCSPLRVCRFELPASNKISVVERPFAERSAIGRIYWLTRGVPQSTSSIRADALLCMSGIGRADIPTFAFIQQSLPFFPEAVKDFSLGNRLRLISIKLLMRDTCRRSAAVFAQTPTMAAWISRDFMIPESGIAVVRPFGDHIGTDLEHEGSIAAIESCPQGRRLLYVGNVDSYKNIGCLVSAVCRVRREIPDATLFLTCPPDHPLCKNEGVVGLGYIGGTTLRQAYKLSTVFITASFVESGNLTLVEALSAGVPVIAADRPYSRDICGSASEYFDPKDPDAAARAIISVLTNSGRRASMIAAGLRVADDGRASRPYDRMIEMLAQKTGSRPCSASAGDRIPGSKVAV